MISERMLARGFPHLWQSVFPMLTSGFMHLFNTSYTKPILGRDGEPVSPVDRSADLNAPDLSAELAIQATKIAAQTGISVAAVLQDEALIIQAWQASLDLFGRYEGSQPDTSATILDAPELEDAILLADNTWSFLSTLDGKVLFGPRIPGAFALPECEADIAVDDLLVEVKTVTRNFYSQDLKQLLVYLALDWATRDRRWTRACLLNPRQGFLADFVVEPFVELISGKSIADAFGELIAGVSRDVEIDTRF